MTLLRSYPPGLPTPGSKMERKGKSFPYILPLAHVTGAEPKSGRQQQAGGDGKNPFCVRRQGEPQATAQPSLSLGKPPYTSLHLCTGTEPKSHRQQQAQGNPSPSPPSLLLPRRPWTRLQPGRGIPQGLFCAHMVGWGISPAGYGE